MNYIKSSRIIFSAKMFGYSHYKYILQEESTQFDRRVLIIFGMVVIKFFELYQVSSLHTDFSVPKCLIPPVGYYLHTLIAFCELLIIFNCISKNWIYFFFLIFWLAPAPPSCWISGLDNFCCVYLSYNASSRNICDENLLLTSIMHVINTIFFKVIIWSFIIHMNQNLSIINFFDIVCYLNLA